MTYAVSTKSLVLEIHPSFDPQSSWENPYTWIPAVQNEHVQPKSTEYISVKQTWKKKAI
jgi:hypothetical protein